MSLFYGTYITNVVEDESQYIRTLDVSKGTFGTDLNLANNLWENVIDAIPKDSSSEAMLSCLYYAIDKTMSKIDSQEIGSTGLSAVNFLVLSDEPLFEFEHYFPADASGGDVTGVSDSDSSLRDYKTLLNRCDWFRSW
jgi:hypothetical protein